MLQRGLQNNCPTDTHANLHSGQNVCALYAAGLFLYLLQPIFYTETRTRGSPPVAIVKLKTAGKSVRGKIRRGKNEMLPQVKIGITT